jgi:hypothetical protein
VLGCGARVKTQNLVSTINKGLGKSVLIINYKNKKLKCLLDLVIEQVLKYKIK